MIKHLNNYYNFDYSGTILIMI